MSASLKDTRDKNSPDTSGASAIDVTAPFVLGDWRIDPASRSATRDDEVVKIDPRNMRVLQILVERHGQIVSQRELETLAWEGVFVTPDSLYQSIRQLRQALQDTKSPAKYIETVPRRGYRLVSRIAADQFDQPSHDGLRHSVTADSKAEPIRRPSHWRRHSAPMLGVVVAGTVLATVVYFVASLRLAEDPSEHYRVGASQQLQSLDRDVKALRALASAELLAGRPDAALKLLERALHVQIAEVGEDNEIVVDVLAELASAYLWLDDDVSAFQTANRALQVLNRGDGVSDIARVEPNSVLAEIFIAAGDYERAEQLLDEAIEISRKHLRSNSQTLRPLIVVPALRLAQGRNADAEQAAREALAAAIEARGGRYIKAGYAHGMLGWALMEQGKLAEAETHARAAIGIAEQETADHPYAWSARHVLAEVLLRQHSPSSAEKLLREELSVLQEQHATGWRVARAASSLGAALLEQGRLDDAERYLFLARGTLTSTKGWPIERENRLLRARLEGLSAMRAKQSSLAKLDR